MGKLTRGKMLLAAIGVLVALAIAGTAWAQTPPGQGRWGGALQGAPGGCHGNGGYHETMWNALAQALGMTTDELNSQLQSGRSIREIAKAKGLSDFDLITAFRNAARTMTDRLVESGQMTREQSDAMLDYMESHMDDNHWLAMADMMGSGGHGWGSMGSMMGGGGMMGSGGPGGHGGMMGSGGSPGGQDFRGGRQGAGSSMMGRYF